MDYLSNSKDYARRTRISRRRIVSETDLKLTIALTDSTRREIIELLNKNPQGMTAKELAEELGLKISTIMSHLKILLEAGAIRYERRTGKNVKRPLKRYFSLVEVKTAKQIEKTVEKAADRFYDYLVDATFNFLIECYRIIPRTSNPYRLSEWLDALMTETCYGVPETVVFLNNINLSKYKRYRELSINAAKAMLFNDFMLLLNDYVFDLYNEKPELVNRIAQVFGYPKIRSENEISFIIDAMYSLLYDPQDKVTKAKEVLLRIIKSLPKERSINLLKFWPYVLRVRELPDDIKSNIVNFFIFDNEKSILERCNKNIAIIEKYGRKDYAKRGP